MCRRCRAKVLSRFLAVKRLFGPAEVLTRRGVDMTALQCLGKYSSQIKVESHPLYVLSCHLGNQNFNHLIKKKKIIFFLVLCKEISISNVSFLAQQLLRCPNIKRLLKVLKYSQCNHRPHMLYVINQYKVALNYAVEEKGHMTVKTFLKSVK